MQITQELFEYLSRAAGGDESDCPPEIDAEWHACLARPKAYAAFCRTNFGSEIEHVVGPPGQSHDKIPGPCKARVSQYVLAAAGRRRD